MENFVSAIIVAAGGSTRMGTADSKQFIPLLGNPAIEYTLKAFQACRYISEIIIVCREQDSARIQQIADKHSITKLACLTNGGSSRARSVCNGIDAVSDEAKFLAIHDGARPLVTTEEIEKVIETAFETGAATLGTPVTDTIKIVDDNSQIVSTPSRSTLRAVQTPQVFDKELYSFALEKAGSDLDSFTDDCSLIENMGGEVEVVLGSSENIKLTTPIDIIIAESILNQRKQDKI